MKEIFTKKFKTPVKIKSTSLEELVFSDGSKLLSDHSADCCECNYADFTSLDDSPILNQVFTTLTFEKVDGYGFKMNGYMVNCYSEQNGYYSSDVDILFQTKNGKEATRLFNIDCELREY